MQRKGGRIIEHEGTVCVTVVFDTLQKQKNHLLRWLTTLLTAFLFGLNMVPGAGLEPAQPYSRGILNPLCLPISPPGQGVTGGASRSRTEVHGFAIRCIATLPTRLKLMCRQVNLACESGAGNETRTRDPDLGNVVLYQLSYSRILATASNLLILFIFWQTGCRSMRCILLT